MAHRCNPAASPETDLPPVNETFAALGLLDWKPVVAALLLPPVPMLVLVLLAWRTRASRPVLSGLMLCLGLVGMWLSHCQGFGMLLQRSLSPVRAISMTQLSELRSSLQHRKPVVLVLSGGTIPMAPEYGEAHLSDRSFQRLHYGLWLARQVQAPVMVSGGAGYAQTGGPSEAAVAARIAARDYGRQVRWLETDSRDTRENARLSLLKLRTEGITDLLLVTDGWHMKRSLRAFEQEISRTGFKVHIVPAPMGMGLEIDQPLRQWLPSPAGYHRVHQALREMIGLLAGA